MKSTSMSQLAWSLPAWLIILIIRIISHAGRLDASWLLVEGSGFGSFLVGKGFADLHCHAGCLHVVVSVVKAASLVVTLLVCTVMLDVVVILMISRWHHHLMHITLWCKSANQSADLAYTGGEGQSQVDRQLCVQGGVSLSFAPHFSASILPLCAWQ